MQRAHYKKFKTIWENQMKMFSYARRAVVLTVLFASLAVTSALAQEARVSIPSNKSFEQTVDAFKMAVSKGGMMIMSTVDQGNMLKMTGLEMKGTLFLVGNPNVGKKVFEQNAAAGLYLPLRVYIYQAADGKAYLSYDKPSVVLKAFNNSSIDQTAGMLDQKLDMLTHMVAQ
jgi:uncharacterized protein (DUF302 family)